MLRFSELQWSLRYVQGHFLWCMTQIDLSTSSNFSPTKARYGFEPIQSCNTMSHLQDNKTHPKVREKDWAIVFLNDNTNEKKTLSKKEVSIFTIIVQRRTPNQDPPVANFSAKQNVYTKRKYPRETESGPIHAVDKECRSSQHMKQSKCEIHLRKQSDSTENNGRTATVHGSRSASLRLFQPPVTKTSHLLYSSSSYIFYSTLPPHLLTSTCVPPPNGGNAK